MPMPSPFFAGWDRATRAHYFLFRYWHLFENDEPYIWVSSQFDRGSVPETVYFPSRALAVNIFPLTLDEGVLEAFETFRTDHPKPIISAKATARPCGSVAGLFHSMHMLWNELPGLDRIVRSGLGAALDIGVMCEPLGPMGELFPELAGRFQPMTLDDVPAFDAAHPFMAGFGDWIIPASVQARVQRVAARHAGPDTVRRRDAFRQAHDPIFWLSMKPPARTCLDQGTALAELIVRLRRAHPRAGFLLDGVSYPWDYAGNSGYMPWFREVMEGHSRGTAAVVADLLGRLPRDDADACQLLSDLPICDEIVWGEICDFYFCHGGTMQNKIGWVHGTPGMIHSNSRFMEAIRGSTLLERDTLRYFLMEGSIIDEDDAALTAVQRARKDQNYRFVSMADVAEQLLAAYQNAKNGRA